MKYLFILLTLISVSATAQDTTNVNVVLSVGQLIKSDSIKVIDKVTNNEIAATFSGVSIQNSSPEIASVSYASRSITIVRVAPGSGTASFSCRVVYTDPGDGLRKSEDKIIIIHYTIEGVAHGATLQVFN